ncbi:hypothetical protein BC829DRAFT_57280 [Chytridium lagenaria]|nr:hypothetical protein BC829DRAFT_57280 [Chytridium lagenaria]
MTNLRQIWKQRKNGASNTLCLRRRSSASSDAASTACDTRIWNMNNIESLAHALTTTYVERRRQEGTYPPDSRFSTAESAFWPRIEGQVFRFKKYLNEDLQDKAREQIPVDEIHDEAARRTSMNPNLRYLDALMLSLMRWFKMDYMQWMNSPACKKCQGPTRFSGHGHPSAQEMADEATSIELHKCEACLVVTPFVRYESLIKLMETRSGRCGEWANLFTLFCIAMGFETRYVLDFTDHVWCEIYNEDEKRWVHLDPSEGEKSFDQPLLYETGWKKKLNFVFAFGEHDAVDVIWRYSRDFLKVYSRRATIREEWLAQKLKDLTATLRRNLPESTLAELNERDMAEKEELLNPPKRVAKESELVGRQSGSKDWRDSRGESGGSSASYSKGSTLFDLTVPDTRATFTGSSKLVHTPTASLVLTESLPDQRGAVWLPTNLDLPLLIEFALRITPSDGADGLALVFQSHSPTALGKGGSELGYGGIPHSLAVEFDTYRSEDSCNDPIGDHISVHTRGKTPNSAHHAFSLGCTTRVPKLATGKPVWVRVVYHRIRDWRYLLRRRSQQKKRNMGWCCRCRWIF